MTNILMFSHYFIGSHNKFRNEYVHERDRSGWRGVETKRGKAEMLWTYAGGARQQQFMDIMSKENSRDRDENNMEVDVFISRWLSEKNFERVIFYILL